MTYKQFVKAALDSGLTLKMLRCDVRPNEALLAFIEEVGHARYERYVQRYEEDVRRGILADVPEPPCGCAGCDCRVLIDLLDKQNARLLTAAKALWVAVVDPATVMNEDYRQRLLLETDAVITAAHRTALPPS
jgi:hypothetical protein